MKSIHIRRFSVGVALAFALCPVAFTASDLPDFSGTYTLENKTHKKQLDSSTRLEIKQNADEITFVRTEAGRTATSRFPLNGGEGVYVSPGGVASKGNATVKGKDLVLDSAALMKPQGGSPTRMHTKQRWQLSLDSKVLTIHFDVDFPDMQSLGGMMNQSWTEKFVRTQ